MSATTPDPIRSKRNNLKEGLERIYTTKEFCDVTFTVGSQKFKAHKLILGSRCTEFERLLLGPNAVTDIIVEDNSVTEIGFQELLCFIYTDTLGTDDKLSIVQAYLAADHFKQKKLKEECERLMQDWLFSIDEVCDLLNISLNIATLREKCLTFIQRNARKVLSSEEFFKLNYAAIVSILDSDALKDVDLKERIVKIIEWVKKHLGNPYDMAAVRNYCLKFSPPLLGKLKIEELEVSEFGPIFTVEFDQLLKSSEYRSFMQYFYTKKKDVLPEWCEKR